MQYKAIQYNAMQYITITVNVMSLLFTELVADLREAILQIARHFDAVDPKKVKEFSVGCKGNVSTSGLHFSTYNCHFAVYCTVQSLCRLTYWGSCSTPYFPATC